MNHGVTVLVAWLSISVISIDFALVVFILFRRASRNRYHKQRDAAQVGFAPIVDQFLSGSMPLGTAAGHLHFRRRAERDAIRELLLGRIEFATRGPVTDLLIALGYAQEWVERAFGKKRSRQLLRGAAQPEHRDLRRRFTVLDSVQKMRLFYVSRAIAVGYLGRLSPEFSKVFMMEALTDPSPFVSRVSVVAIGRAHIAGGVPVLLEQLRRATAGESELPVRAMKAALVRFSLSDFDGLPSMLSNSASRFRFLAIDSIREICLKSGAEGLPPDLRKWLLEQAVVDPSADVRARSASVIAHLRDRDSVDALRKLLKDDNEYVRLHCVRGCADTYYAELAEAIVERATDSKWRVREAAVRTLGTFHELGRRSLDRLFLDSSDRYASEQIAEHLQSTGIATQIVTGLTSPSEHDDAVRFCSRMAKLGMVSLMTNLLLDSHMAPLRTDLFEILSGSDNSDNAQFTSALKSIELRDADPLKNRAALLLRQRQTLRVAVAAAGATA